MTSLAPEPVAERESRPPLLGRGMVVLFVALIGCFTAWGVAQDLTTPMVAGFKRIFEMSTFQASLVQLAYFGAYFLLALPAAFLNQRFGYKVGILTGLGLAALGAFSFYPASKIMTYEAFLVALFAMAAGCSMLETSANPYVMSLGPEETATRRLNFAQAFNPVGTNLGVLLAATLIFPKLADPVDISSLTPEELHEIRADELGAVMGPYLGLSVLLVLIAIVIATQKAPPIVEEFPDTGPHEGSLFRVLWHSGRYRYGVVAQFANVAAQVCVWTFVIQYVQQALGGSLEQGGFYLQISLLVFLFSRFFMTWLIGRVSATRVLAVLAFVAVGLCAFAMASPNLAGVIAVVALSFCLSLMFPTIYGVALAGLGPATNSAPRVW
jgi:FHS family L-fucose permease-like MFS transporter